MSNWAAAAFQWSPAGCPYRRFASIGCRKLSDRVGRTRRLQLVASCACHCSSSPYGSHWAPEIRRGHAEALARESTCPWRGSEMNKLGDSVVYEDQNGQIKAECATAVKSMQENTWAQTSTGNVDRQPDPWSVLLVDSIYVCREN